MAKKGKSKGTIKGWFFRQFVKIFIITAIVGGAGYWWYSNQDEKKQQEVREYITDQAEYASDRISPELQRAWEWISSQFRKDKAVAVSATELEGDNRFFIGGAPKTETNLLILENTAYIVGYDEYTRNPAWVAYKAIFNPSGQTAERPGSFDTDFRTKSRVTHNDYTRSGYDRGHMAPNYAIGKGYGERAQMETFLMSNIVPQKPNLNRRIWREIEQIIANDYVENFREIWVITGPIYEGSVHRLPSGVAVPTSFYMILADVTDKDELRLLGFIIPQEVEARADPASFLVSVDEIEAKTQIDFFALLNDTLENTLEQAAPVRLW